MSYKSTVASEGSIQRLLLPYQLIFVQDFLIATVQEQETIKYNNS